MAAPDYLADDKRRLLRINSTDEFDMYDTYTGLLGVHLTDVMSDSPNVRIGDLVVPELTLTLSHTDMTELSGVTLTAEVGLEQSRENVTDRITAIYTASGSGRLVFARSVIGHYFVADGRNLYYCREGTTSLVFGFESESVIESIIVEESTPDNDSGVSYGHLYLCNRDVIGHYLRKITFIGRPMGVTFGSETAVSTGDLQQAIVHDYATRHESFNRISYVSEEPDVPDVLVTERLEIRYSTVYRDGALHRTPIFGEVTRYAADSYGEFVLSDTDAQDEETDEARCYGILSKARDISAADFFTESRFRTISTFLGLYNVFLEWLTGQGLPLTAATQPYLNLPDMQVVQPDWQTADFSVYTAADVLRGLAVIEGGNARINCNGELVLGWCSKEPTMTVSADVLGSLRIGAEQPRRAQGIDLRNQEGGNVIETGQRPEQMWMQYFIDGSEYDIMCDNIISNIDNRQRIPITADLLIGASPLLRAGDSIRVVTKSGATIVAEIMQQDVDAFPHMEARISSPDHTDWTTWAVDYEQVLDLRVTGWPEYVISGFAPDISGMVVEAEIREGVEYVYITVYPGLYTFICNEEPRNNRCAMAVRAMGTQKTAFAELLYPMTTALGELLTTDAGDILAVKGEQ